MPAEAGVVEGFVEESDETHTLWISKLFNQLTVILCDQGIVHSLLIILRGRDMPKPYAIEPATAGSGERSGGTNRTQCIN